MEAQIVSGLKRPASGKLTAGLGVGRKPRGTALRLAALCGEAVSAARRAGRGLGRWAVGRSISPNSLAGISLLFAICAAAWFSAGPAAGGARGLVAAGGWLVGLGAARSLAAFAAGQSAFAGGQSAKGSPPGRRVARARFARARVSRARVVQTGDDSTDWLVLPVTWEGAESPGGVPPDGGPPDDGRGDPVAGGVTADGVTAAGVPAARVTAAGVTAAGVTAAGVTAG